MIISPLENRDALEISTKIAGSAMRAQSARMQVVAQNIANADATASIPDGDPYARKTVTFKQEMDRNLDAELVSVRNIGVDRTPFNIRYEPGHPAANEKGFVKTPNVNVMVELADMQEANRSFSANVQMIKFSRTLSSMTIDLLRT